MNLQSGTTSNSLSGVRTITQGYVHDRLALATLGAPNKAGGIGSTPLDADRLYQIAAVTAGLILLATLL